jgi:hypothetical protein
MKKLILLILFSSLLISISFAQNRRTTLNVLANPQHLQFITDVTGGSESFDTLEVSTISAKTSDGLYITDDSLNGMFIEDGGNVGIGTDQPSELLGINGNTKITSALYCGTNLEVASKFGLGTSVVPLASIGIARMGIHAGTGLNSPAIQLTNITDNYPLLSIYSFDHDDTKIIFDGYSDPSDRSSDSGSNFIIQKNSDLLKIKVDSGISQGSAITWNDSIVVSTEAQVGIQRSPSESLDVNGNIRSNGIVKADHLWTKIDEYTNLVSTTGVTFTLAAGEQGDDVLAYKFIIIGKINTNDDNDVIFIRPNGDSTGGNYVSSLRFWGTTDGDSDYTNGLAVIRPTNNAASEVYSEVFLQTQDNGNTWSRKAFGNGSLYQVVAGFQFRFDMVGIWENTSSNITSIDIDVDSAGTFTGDIFLYKLVDD